MSYFYFDFETFLIQPGCQAPPIVCMSYAWDDGPVKILHANFDSLQLAVELDKALRGHTLVAHNAGFEVLCILANNPSMTSLVFEALRQGRVQCTQGREQLIRVGLGKRDDKLGLDKLCEQYKLPVPDKKNPWRVRFGELWDVPVHQWPREAYDYSAGDIAVRDIYKKQEPYAKYLVDQHHQMRGAVSLKLTQAWGFPTDLDAAETLIAATEVQLREDEKTLFKHGLVRAEVKRGVTEVIKTKAAAEARITQAFAAQGREVLRGEPTEKMLEKGITQGNIRLDEEACTFSGDPVMESYSRYSRGNTLLGKTRRLRHSPIQCSYNVLVATGRTSCRQGDDPEPGEPWTAYGMQMQNLPRAGEEYIDSAGKKRTKPGARECFVARGYLGPTKRLWTDEIVARDKMCIVSVDFDAFEMRTWAQCCLWILGYSDLAEILNDVKRCPHVEMGARLKSISTADAYALKSLDSKAFKDLRGVAKGPNFGLPGGMGWLRLIDYCRQNYGVVLDEQQARNACKVWRQIYREAQPYLDWVSAQVGRERGSKAAITQFVSKRIRGNVGFTDAANGFFQGLAADAAKAAGWALIEEAYEKRNSPLYGCRPLAFVHDEWIFEVPRYKLHEAAHRMRDVQVAAAQAYCPDVVLTASPAAAYRWSKEAGDPVYRNGELIPFEERDAA